jgi:hypothetical protein
VFRNYALYPYMSVRHHRAGERHRKVTVLTRRLAAALALKRLFAPLGIREDKWLADPDGVTAGGFGLMLQPRSRQARLPLSPPRPLARPPDRPRRMALDCGDRAGGGAACVSRASMLSA